MPNKTIYVSDADLPVFERAQELAGANLSATITNALRKLVEERAKSALGMHEVEVKVGKVAYTYKRFTGRLIAKGRVRDRKASPKVFEVYQTAKGKLAVYTKVAPEDWSFLANPVTAGNAGAWMADEGEYSLEVYETVEDLKGHIPDELYDAVVQTLSGNTVEELDI